MVAPSSTKKNVPKIRTYAHDLEIEREQHGPTTDNQSADKAVTAVAPHKNIVHSPTVSIPKSNSTLPIITTFHDKKTTPIDPVIKTPPQVSKPTTKNAPHDHILVPPKASVVKPVTVPVITTSQSNQPEVRDSEYAATIITDSKHKRFSLTAEVSKSLVAWWTDQVEKFKERKKPKYTVPKAELRKGIVQRATSGTAKSNTGDYAQVVQRIKEAKRTQSEQTTTETVVPKKGLNTAIGYEQAASVEVESITPKPNTQIIETDSNLHTPLQTEFDAVTAANTLSKELDGVINQEAPTEITDIKNIAALVEAVSTPIVPTIPLPSKTKHEIIVPAIPIKTEPETSWTAPTTIATESISTTLPPIEHASISKTTARTNNIPRKATATNNLRSYLLNLLSLHQYISTTIKIISATFLLVTGIVIIFIITRTDTTVVETPYVLPTTASTADGSYYEIILNINTKQELFTAIEAKRNTDKSFIEVSILDTNTNQVLRPSTVLNLISPHLITDFRESINLLRLGDYRNQPWILMTVANHNTARGGLYSWETTLTSDLSPWFGPSFNSTNVGKQSNFKDGVIEGRDVRTLLDNDGRERITYGFITQNRILITTDTTTFLNLMNQLQSQ